MSKQLINRDTLLNQQMWESALTDKTLSRGLVAIFRVLMMYPKTSVCGAALHLKQIIEKSKGLIFNLTTECKFSEVTTGMRDVAAILNKLVELRLLLPDEGGDPSDAVQRLEQLFDALSAEEEQPCPAE